MLATKLIMSTTAVRLSTLAEMTKVRMDIVHKNLRLPRILSHDMSESKTPLLWSTSTMVLVAMRKRMTEQASMI